MDYPLGAYQSIDFVTKVFRLNPYSNGLPSRGLSPGDRELQNRIVLIPILMDYPLGVEKRVLNEDSILS